MTATSEQRGATHVSGGYVGVAAESPRGKRQGELWREGGDRKIEEGKED